MPHAREMTAVYYDEFGKTPVLSRLPIPSIEPTSVLVQVKASGICRSDWHGWMGHDRDIQLPHVPGHEFAGIISAVGSEVKGWNIGQRVTTPFVQACGKCDYCLQQDHQVCEFQEQAGFSSWGSFAQYVEVKNAMVNLVELPNDMDFATAAVLGCRFGTAYRALRDQAKIRETDYLLVIGCGGVGLSSIMIAQALGVHVAAMDLNPEARKLAGKCGAAITLNSLDEKGKKEILAWSGKGVHACVDAIGVKDLLGECIGLLRRRGRYVQVGLLPDQMGVPSFSFERVVAHELEVIGSHGIQAWQYRNMLDFIRLHKLPIHKIITGTCTLHQSIGLLTTMPEVKTPGVKVILQK
ncbi:MAG: alcohol dehydrogenase catalytic domain-containing protein [Saprospiraceae bacterium]|nr:alcohol dehydrogenase catalytic domain-containing protein [Saprospiraceae bacterium]